MDNIVEKVLVHHLTAFGYNDLDEIMKDYTETSVVLTPNGSINGLVAIRNFFEDFFHFEHMIQGVVLEEFQHGHAAQLVPHAGRQFFFNFMVAVFNFLQGSDRVLYLEKAHIYPGLEEVGGHFHRGNGYHSPVNHIQSQPLKNDVYLLIQQSADLFLSFTFFHINWVITVCRTKLRQSLQK